MLGAMQEEQKNSILLLNLFKGKKKKDKQTNKQKKTSEVDWLPSLKCRTGAVIGMTGGTSLSVSPPY